MNEAERSRLLGFSTAFAKLVDDGEADAALRLLEDEGYKQIRAKAVVAGVLGLWNDLRRANSETALKEMLLQVTAQSRAAEETLRLTLGVHRARITALGYVVDDLQRRLALAEAKR